MPNFFLSYKRAEVAGRMAPPLRRQDSHAPWSWCPLFEANVPRSGPRAAGIHDEITGRDEGAVNAPVPGALTGVTGDEALQRMGDVGRAGARCDVGECPD